INSARIWLRLLLQVCQNTKVRPGGNMNNFKLFISELKRQRRILLWRFAVQDAMYHYINTHQPYKAYRCACRLNDRDMMSLTLQWFLLSRMHEIMTGANTA